jgi:pyruvate formate lyase activating enzyme
MKGVIFDIQSYAIHDGPGIRTCVFFKGCPLRCAWCHNPESQSHEVEVAYRQPRCAGCGRCVQVCPRGALSLQGGEVRRDARCCVACGACADACPDDAMAMIGYEIAAEEVARVVEQDKPFYDEAGGGVTLTGGEPTSQAGFLLALLGELRERGIHTALETCGNFSKKLVDRLVEAVDLFLFDIKHLSDQKHKQATGAGNRRILENFRAIVDRVGEERVIVRIPVIPGFNSDPDSVASTAKFLARRKWHGPVQLLAHHAWAQDKYRMLGREAPRFATGSISLQQRGRIVSIYVENGLTPVWS